MEPPADNNRLSYMTSGKWENITRFAAATIEEELGERLTEQMCRPMLQLVGSSR